MEAFLEKERAQWTCRDCGHLISVHTGVCSGCGRQYGALAYQMDADTWRIEDGGVRCFLLKGAEQALLIDTGMTIHHVRQMAEALAGQPVLLLNTHADRDHTGCNEAFEAFRMHPDDEAQYRASGKGGRLIPVRDGDEIDLGNRKLRIIHLPGHTPGSIAVLDISRRVLISGDPIQEHGRIFMFGPNRNLPDYIASLEKLEGMLPDFDELWPSHADLPISPAVIRRLHDEALKILRKEKSGKKTAFFGREITEYDLGFTFLLCDE